VRPHYSRTARAHDQGPTSSTCSSGRRSASRSAGRSRVPHAALHPAGIAVATIRGNRARLRRRWRAQSFGRNRQRGRKYRLIGYAHRRDGKIAWGLRHEGNWHVQRRQEFWRDCPDNYGSARWNEKVYLGRGDAIGNGPGGNRVVKACGQDVETWRGQDGSFRGIEPAELDAGVLGSRVSGFAGSIATACNPKRNWFPALTVTV